MDEELLQLSRCIICEITVGQNEQPYVRCTECSSRDNEVNLCASCFLMGAECGAHKRGHNYQVEDPCGPPVFNAKAGIERPWGWKQDMKLIHTAHKYRLGNWDEIAKCMKTNRTAEEVKNHFDRYFVRGAVGQYASTIVSRPFIDDMTVDECFGRERDPIFVGDDTTNQLGAATYNSSKWQYIREFVSENNVLIDLDEPNWMDTISDKVKRYKERKLQSSLNLLNSSSTSSSCSRALFIDTTPINSSSHHFIDAVIMPKPSITPYPPTPPLSPIRITIHSVDASSDESSELGMANHHSESAASQNQQLNCSAISNGGNKHARTRRCFSSQHPSSAADTSYATSSTSRPLSNIGLQSSGDETDHSTPRNETTKRRVSLPGPSRTKRRVSSSSLSKKEHRGSKQQHQQIKHLNGTSSSSTLTIATTPTTSSSISNKVSAMNGSVCAKSIRISERDQERLLATYTEAYLRMLHAAEMQQQSSRAQKMSRLREDDLQLLAYMPKRDDFEYEYNNEFERLISRLQLSPTAEEDENEQFADDVKISKVLYYNRQMMQRRQRKNMLREFDLINEFFDKIKVVVAVIVLHSFFLLLNNATATRKNPSTTPGGISSCSAQVRLASSQMKRTPTARNEESSANQHHYRDEQKNVLINKVRQVVNKEEFKQLNDVIRKLESSSKRIEQLKDLKARGVKVLKPGQKIDSDHHTRRRKRRGDKYKSSQRKAALRWNRFKRWNKRQQLQSEAATESDT
ncbi:unnamed protein product [Anisakis simplex]|uniref:CULLIN_2 domain-containing protein n=1 Tax=Anisakis simplex TaxID=6269 RepID=A0A0M3JU25_ANISI|nr:unnamed protein product [Anisakis simplex]